MTMTAKRSLFDIGEDLLALESLIESLDGDISDPAVDAAITEWFAEMAQNQGAKCDNYVALIRKWEMESSAAKAEAEQYAKAAKVREARITRLKERLKQHMELTRQTKIETPTGRTIAIQNNGGSVPLIIDANVQPDRLEERFQRKTITLDAEAVRKALDAKETLPFAQLGQRGTHLRIK